MTRFYTFDVQAADAEVSVFANGVLVEVFTPGQSGGGPLNSWLRNGVNEVVFTMKSMGDDARAMASLELSGPDGYEPLAKYEWPGAEASVSATLEAEGIPDWSWLRGDPAPGAADEVKAAVEAAHAQVKDGDREAFFAAAAALNADMAALSSRKQVDENNGGLWKLLRKGLSPLGELNIVSFRDGQVYRVTGAEDMGPIQAVDEDGGVISVGKWWSKVDGTWQMIK